MLKPFAAAARRRADEGQFDDDELYPCEAHWSGLYDRMSIHTDDETAHRMQIAADHGARSDG